MTYFPIKGKESQFCLFEALLRVDDVKMFSGSVRLYDQLGASGLKLIGIFHSLNI